ncbi:relaxase/mobilization nuclease domain-containing protein [Chryseobacterium sp. A301]
MRVFLLGSKSTDFAVVRYHRDKLDYETGELMAIQNFPESIMESKEPAEIRAYLQKVSQKSRSKQPQFHAVVTSFQQTNSKKELSKVAQALMREHGYEKQPYVIIFHRDTEHNHVHIVSTRISVETGFKLRDFYEMVALNDALVRALKDAHGLDFQAQAEALLNYRYSTRQDLKTLLASNYFQLYYSKRNDDFKIVYGLGTLLRRKVDEISFSQELPLSRLQAVQELFESEKSNASNLVFGAIEFRKPFANSRKEVPKRPTKDSKVLYLSELGYRMKSLYQLDLILKMNPENGSLEGTLIDPKTSSVFGPEHTVALVNFFKWTDTYLEATKFFSFNAYNIEGALQKKLVLSLNSKSNLKEYMLFKKLEKPHPSLRQTARIEVLEYIHNPLQSGVRILKFPSDNKHYAFHERLHHVEALESLVEPKVVNKYLEMERKFGAQKESSDLTVKKIEPTKGALHECELDPDFEPDDRQGLEEKGLVTILQDLLVPTLVGNTDKEEQKRKRKKRSI